MLYTFIRESKEDIERRDEKHNKKVAAAAATTTAAATIKCDEQVKRYMTSNWIEIIFYFISFSVARMNFEHLKHTKK